MLTRRVEDDDVKNPEEKELRPRISTRRGRTGRVRHGGGEGESAGGRPMPDILILEPFFRKRERPTPRSSMDRARLVSSLEFKGGEDEV